MLERCSLVYFNKKFRDSNITLSENDWARCMLCIAENFSKMPPPKIDESVERIFEIERDDD